MTDRLLRRKAAIEKINKVIPMSPSTFDRMRRDPDFPVPVQIRPTTRTVAWRERELDEYLTSMPRAA